jgi:hypothetical protein
MSFFYDDFTQLNMRTEDKLIFDYNPSESASWLYDLPKEESILIKSTYRDNPFLPDSNQEANRGSKEN